MSALVFSSSLVLQGVQKFMEILSHPLFFEYVDGSYNPLAWSMPILVDLFWCIVTICIWTYDLGNIGSVLDQVLNEQKCRGIPAPTSLSTSVTIHPSRLLFIHKYPFYGINVMEMPSKL